MLFGSIEQAEKAYPKEKREISSNANCKGIEFRDKGFSKSINKCT